MRASQCLPVQKRINNLHVTIITLLCLALVATINKWRWRVYDDFLQGSYPRNFKDTSQTFAFWHELKFLIDNQHSFKLTKKKSAEQGARIDGELPSKRYIFFVWLGGKPMSGYLQLCLETFKKHNGKDFEIVVIDENNMMDFIPEKPLNFEVLSLNHQSDYLRIALLYYHGGFYFDVDSIAVRPLRTLYETCINTYPVNGYDDIPYSVVPVLGSGAYGPVRKKTELLGIWMSRMEIMLTELSPFMASKDVLGWTTLNLLRWKPSIDIEAKFPYAYLGRQLFIQNPLPQMLVKTVEDSKFTLNPDTHVIILNNKWMPKEVKSLTKEEFLRSKFNNTLLSSLLQSNIGKK